MSTIPIVNGSEPTQRERLEAMIRAAKADLAANTVRDVAGSPVLLNRLLGDDDTIAPSKAAELVSQYAISLADNVIGHYSPKDLV